MQNRFILCILMITAVVCLLSGCGKDSPITNEGIHPGELRWPRQIGSDSAQYGEQVLIPGGTFQMGWIDGDPAPACGALAQPTSTVTISSFWLDKYEVTNAAYRDFLVTNNIHHTIDYDIVPPDNIQVNSQSIPWYGDSNKGNYCLMGVPWWGAIKYANWRSRIEGLQEVYTNTDHFLHYMFGNFTIDSVCWDRTKNGYHLPTEAEWEYAARGSTNLQYAWGSSFYFDTTSQVARCAFNSFNISDIIFRDTANQRHIFYGPIGRFRSNPSAYNPVGPFGNYDLNGGAPEWVYDLFSGYTTTIKTDPVNDIIGVTRVIRGGSQITSGDLQSIGAQLLSYDRARNGPDNEVIFIGFRLARNQ